MPEPESEYPMTENLKKTPSGRYKYYNDQGKVALRIEPAAPPQRAGYAVLNPMIGGFIWIAPEDVDAVCDAIREAAAKTAGRAYVNGKAPKPATPNVPDYDFYKPDDVLLVRTEADGPVIAYGVKRGK